MFGISPPQAVIKIANGDSDKKAKFDQSVRSVSKSSLTADGKQQVGKLQENNPKTKMTMFFKSAQDVSFKN